MKIFTNSVSVGQIFGEADPEAELRGCAVERGLANQPPDLPGSSDEADHRLRDVGGRPDGDGIDGRLPVDVRDVDEVIVVLSSAERVLAVDVAAT